MKKIFLIAFLLVLIRGPGGAHSEASMGGVGILLDYDPPGSGNVVVYSVTYRSPADKAKVKRGDKLIRVDDNEVTGKSLEDIAQLIRGPVGTPVVLTLVRGGSRLQISVVRKTLQKGAVLSLPPPSKGGKGVSLSPQEKALVKEKIVSLKTDGQRQRMMQLLQKLKAQKISKSQFMETLKKDFP